MEGLFGRTFRSSVQPVELARKLAKEMDDHRTISIHRVYVPNTYTVYLNPADREQFAAYETQMCNELAEYLVEHARREGYSTATRPVVLLESEPDLAVGMFGIAVGADEGGDDRPGPAATVAVPEVPAGAGAARARRAGAASAPRRDPGGRNHGLRAPSRSPNPSPSRSPTPEPRASARCSSGTAATSHSTRR